MGSRVDEVAERDERGRKTDCWAIEGCDENFGMCVEGVSDFEVIGYKTFECLATDVSGSWERFGNRDVGTTTVMVSISCRERKNFQMAYAEK